VQSICCRALFYFETREDLHYNTLVSILNSDSIVASIDTNKLEALTELLAEYKPLMPITPCQTTTLSVIDEDEEENELDEDDVRLDAEIKRIQRR